MVQATKHIALIAGVLLAGASFAQAPAGAPAGSNGMCKDGTYSTAAVKKGACRGHKGVAAWYAADSTAAAAAVPSVAPAPVPAPAAAPAPTPAPAAAPAASTSMKKTTSTYTPPATAAAGGGPGMVWVNKKVYHCSTDKWYGKTKEGSYMSEADAKAAGAHPDHGKACGA
jgi:hypothetical protein